jgi:type II secretory pathway predicted ATPase ExeA
MSYKEARELFKDIIDVELYIPLISSQKIEIDIKYAISQKDKIVLLSGEAGSGKSFILNKIYEDLKDTQDIEFIKNPYLDIKKIEPFFSATIENHKVILVDEAQILSQDDIENLRLLSDSGKFTIVFATHISNAKEIFALKHFQTRINYNLQIHPIKLIEVEGFINAKLMKHGFTGLSSMLTSSNYKAIYNFTNGNLREINRLVNKTFDILEYFSSHYPHKVSTKKIQNKYIEMAHIDLKGNNA